MKGIETSADVAPPRRRGCGCWTLVFVALLGATTSVVGVYGYWRWSNARGVERMIAIAREKGEPTTPEDFVARRSSVTESERTEQLWLAALAAAQPSGLTDEEWYDIPIVGEIRPGDDDAYEARSRYNLERVMSREMFAAAKRFLPKASVAIESVREAQRTGPASQALLPPDLDGPTLSNSLWRYRGLANLVTLDLEVRRLEEGENLAESLLTLLALAQTLKDDPRSGARETRLDLLDAASIQALHSLAAAELSNAELLNLQNAWGEVDLHPSLLDDFLMTQAYVIRGASSATGFQSPCPEEEAFQSLTALRSLIDGSNSLPEAGTTIENVRAQARLLLNAPLSDVRFDTLDSVTKNAGGDWSMHCRVQSRAGALVILLACERFRHVRGEWPSSLEELASSYLPSVPADPFGGGPLKYVREANSAVAYAVGDDGYDDVGSINLNDGLDDWGFRLTIGERVLRVADENEPSEAAPIGEQ